MPNTPPPPLDDETVRRLGEGIRDHFVGLYPFLGLSLPDRLRAIVRHYGGQRPAARAIGTSDRTLRRWLAGTARPRPAGQAAADSRYLSIHLALNGFSPGSAVERRLAAAWSRGDNVMQLGKIMEDVLTVRNAVPATLTIRGRVTFEPGMGRMFAGDSHISGEDDRYLYPFNTGTYSA